MKDCLLAVSLCCQLLAVSFGNSGLYAQSDVANNAETLKIYSLPRGAYVEVNGSYSFIGRTPFVIPVRLVGKYRIKASMAGYETYKATVNLSSRRASKITLKLSPRTRFKSSYRSFLLPGWGQMYGQSTFKGFLVGITQATLGVITLFAIDDYQAEKDDYEFALSNFEQVKTNLGEAEAAFLIVQKEFGDLNDAKDFRDAMVLATAGFWLYNVVDAIFFFSGRKKTATATFGLAPHLGVPGSPGEIGLSMRVRL